MKHTRLLTILTAAALLLPLTGCGKAEYLYYRYDYDLSEYITLAEYKNLPVEMADFTVTEEQVQNQITSTVMYFAQEVEVDRASVQWDTVKFSCTAELDGEELAEYSEEEGSLRLGFATYGEEVDKALTGVKAGDTVTAERVLTGLVSNEELAGKTIQYTFQITGVYETEDPIYNDLFVKAYLGYDSVAEYEASVRESLEASAETARLNSLVSQTWPVVVENTVVNKYPEKEMEQIVDQLVAEVEAYTSAAGIQFGEYTKLVYGKTEEEFRDYAAEVAEGQLKEDMIVYAIARAEDLDIPDDLYHTYAHLFMEQLGYSTEEELEQHYTTGAIREAILGDLVKECIAEYAVEK
ncbi:MAG: hypothetical protein IJX14_01015 [Clostridia bacterium]|nr:hypothetical protein [Clostridia bacterium]